MPVIHRVKELINLKNISQPKLGAASGVHKNTIQKMLANNTEPSIKVVIGLKKLFPNLSFEWLILGEGEMWVEEKGKEDSVLAAHGKRIGDMEAAMDGLQLQFAKLLKKDAD